MTMVQKAVHSSGAWGDKRVSYHHDPQQRSLGSKRNQLVSRALGEYIVQFDDDDWYAPSYVSHSIASLIKYDADIRKLTGSFIFDQRNKRLFYWDQTESPEFQFVCKPGLPLHTRKVNPIIQEKAARHRLGYGYSYVYKRKVWEAIKFPEWDFAEDLYFMESAINTGFSPLFVQDHEGLCLHIIHASNLSGCFPQFMIPTFLLKKIFPEIAPIFL
jgi:glycosyltransferase involved in cell wall biosynthesis